MTAPAVWLVTTWPAATELGALVACLLTPFAVADLVIVGLFRLDDRHWRKAWRAYWAADIPRPEVLGNVVPRGNHDHYHAADYTAEISTEVNEDD